MALPMPYPDSRRQHISRIPVYLPVDFPNKSSSSASGSWRTSSVDSKSTSISSGYGTPRVENYCRHLHPLHPLNSSLSNLSKNSVTSEFTTLIEENELVLGRKRSYHALKQHPGELLRILLYY